MRKGKPNPSPCLSYPCVYVLLCNCFWMQLFISTASKSQLVFMTCCFYFPCLAKNDWFCWWKLFSLVSCLLNSTVADVWLKSNIRIHGKIAFHLVLKHVWERKRLRHVDGMWQFSVCRILWRLWTNGRLCMCASPQIILSGCSYLEDVEGFK